jgi:hypothetical protein
MDHAASMIDHVVVTGLLHRREDQHGEAWLVAPHSNAATLHLIGRKVEAGEDWLEGLGCGGARLRQEPRRANA